MSKLEDEFVLLTLLTENMKLDDTRQTKPSQLDCPVLRLN